MKIAVCVKAVPDAASGRHLDPTTGRRNAGKHPWHFHGVSEEKDHLIYKLVFADGA